MVQIAHQWSMDHRFRLIINYSGHCRNHKSFYRCLYEKFTKFLITLWYSEWKAVNHYLQSKKLSFQKFDVINSNSRKLRRNLTFSSERIQFEHWRSVNNNINFFFTCMWSGHFFGGYGTSGTCLLMLENVKAIDVTRNICFVLCKQMSPNLKYAFCKSTAGITGEPKACTSKYWCC